MDKHSRIRRHSPGRLSESTGPPSISTRVHRRLPRGEALIVAVASSLGFWRVTLEAISFAIRAPMAIREELSPEPVHELLPPRPEVSEPPSNAIRAIPLARQRPVIKLAKSRTSNDEGDERNENRAKSASQHSNPGKHPLKRHRELIPATPRSDPRLVSGRAGKRLPPSRTRTGDYALD